MGSGSCVAASLTPTRSATMQRGYTGVIRRGRQINEPTEPGGTETVRYWLEAPAVARTLIGVHTPLEMNYETIGNSLPHLHTHLLPRFPDDPHLRQPLPLTAQQPDQHIPEARLLAEAAALRSLPQSALCSRPVTHQSHIPHPVILGCQSRDSRPRVTARSRGMSSRSDLVKGAIR